MLIFPAVETISFSSFVHLLFSQGTCQQLFSVGEVVSQPEMTRFSSEKNEGFSIPHVNFGAVLEDMEMRLYRRWRPMSPSKDQRA